MTYPSNLRALSIAGPYAWLIATGQKYAEYRTWPITSLKGLILLHNSTTREWDADWHEFIESGDITREQAMKQKGHVIGFAFLAGCDSAKPDGYDGFYHWMDGAALFDELIPAPGARNYWTAKKEAQQQAFSRAWELIQAGKFTAYDPPLTDECMIDGYRKPRTFITRPGGQAEVN